MERGHEGRVIATLRRDISEGRYAAHGHLPSYRLLADRHGVTTRMVRKAMDRLEQEGLIYRSERRGTFVQPRVISRGRTGERAKLRWINFLVRGDAYAEEHARIDYLMGYSDAFETWDLRMRFVSLSDNGSLESLFSRTDDPSGQGCVFISMTDPALMENLDRHGIPYVIQFYGQYSRDGLPPHHSVIANKFRGSFTATEHLLKLGHRRIGFMGSAPTSRRAIGVYPGYCAALQCAGLAVNPGDVLQVIAAYPDAAIDAATAYLKSHPRVTAIQTSNDAMAIALLQAARDLAIRVPRDLSVIGFNNEVGSAETSPSLTTVDNPRRTLAREAVELLMAVAEGQREPFQNRVLDCHLVVRDSAAAPEG